MNTIQHVFRRAISDYQEKTGDTWIPRNLVRSFIPEIVFANEYASVAEIGSAEYGLARWVRSHIGTVVQVIPKTTGLTDEQSEAIYGICEQKLALLTGGPGTGKTTAIKRYIEACEDDGLLIKLVSPTGKGAVQLSKACDNRHASTMHSLLRRIEATEKQLLKNGQREETDPPIQIEADVFVLDEAGMWDAEIGYQIVRRIPHHARVIVLGDCGQLPSVRPGNVLEDLCRIKEIPRWHLTRIHRYEDGGPIANACYDILSGNIPRHEDNGNNGFHLLTDCSSPFDSIIAALREAMKRLHITIYDCRVLTPYRDVAWGLNQAIKSAFNPSYGKEPTQGDIIINLRNNYDLEIMNGETAIVNENGLAEFPNGTICYLSDIQYALGYATTIHKSQGGQWPYIVVFVPSNRGFGFVDREMLNTAISRATKRCLYIGSEKGLISAVRRNQRKRFTLLPQFFAGMEITSQR